MVPAALIERLQAQVETDEAGRLSLELFASPATDDDLAQLLLLANLRELYVIGGRTSDAGLKHIGKMRQLELLSLGQTNVTDRGLTHLSGLTRLRVLSLSRTAVSDAGLHHLSGMSELEILNVTQTRVTAEGIARLKSALPRAMIIDRHQPAWYRLAYESVLLPRFGSQPI